MNVGAVLEAIAIVVGVPALFWVAYRTGYKRTLRKNKK